MRNVDDVKSFLNDAMLHARLMEISEVRERMKMKKEIPRSSRAKAPENCWFEDVCLSFWGLVNFQVPAEKKTLEGYGNKRVPSWIAKTV